jgi:uncharacterized protein (DUF433 family)
MKLLLNCIKKRKIMTSYAQYITTDHRIMLGKPVLTGTRLTVESILRKLSHGATQDDLMSMYPHLSKTHISAVLEYAADVLANEDILVSAA